MGKQILVLIIILFSGFVAASEGPEKRVILFHAKWCKYCPSQERIVKSVEQKGYKVRYVDIDKEKDITRAFKITGVPTTLIVTMNGNDAVEHRRFSGQTSPETLLNALK